MNISNTWLLSFGYVTAGFSIFFLMLDSNNPLTYFKAYRRLRKGRWAKTSSLIPWVPYTWTRVCKCCLERIDEEYL
jgi:hypothetical protein